MILEEGLNVKTLLFPDGEDPDSFAQSKSEEELRDFISENATDFIQFKSKILAEEAKGDPIKTANMIKELVNSIALIPDPITRSVYIRECASIMHMDEQVLVSELNKARRKAFADKQKRESGKAFSDTDIPMPEEPFAPQQFPTEETISDIHQERDIVRLLLMYGNKNISLAIEPKPTGDDSADENSDPVDPVKEEFNVATLICDEMQENTIVLGNTTCNVILNEFNRMIDDGNVPDHHHFLAFPDPEVTKLAVELISSKHTLSENWKKHNILVATEEQQLERAVLSSLNAIKLRRVEAVIREVRSTIENCSAEEIDDKLRHLQQLLALRGELAKDIGAIILR